MKVGQKRAMALLYTLGLCISLGLSFYSSSKQTEGLTSINALIKNYHQREDIQKRIDLYQNKLHVITQEFLGKKDNWVEELSSLTTRQLSIGVVSEDQDEKFHQELAVLAKLKTKPSTITDSKERKKALKDNLVNYLKEERRILFSEKLALSKKIFAAEGQVVDRIKDLVGLFTTYSLVMSGLFTLFIFLINLNKKNIKKLEVAQKKRDFMLDSLDCAVVLLGRDQKVLSYNKKCQQIWSMDSLSSLEQLFSKVEYESEVDEEETLIEVGYPENPLVKAISSGRVEKGLTFHFKMRTLSLGPQWFQVDAKSFKDDLYLISLTNTTHLYQAKELIKKQQKSLIEQSKMSALGQMSGGMAHEINNPLAIISSEAEELLEIAQEEDGVAKDDATSISINIKKTTDRIAKIIRGLRIFSRTESGGEKEVANLHELIEEVMVMTSEKFKTKGVVFHHDLPVSSVEENNFDNGAAQVYCNQVQIIQVLVNLLNNSYDAVKEQRERKIDFVWKELPESHLIIVKDNGPGVPQNIRNKIFDPFFTTKKVGEGTGLGLSLSKSIMEDHGGELSYVEGDDGHHFQIKIPKLNRQDKEASLENDEDESWAS